MAFKEGDGMVMVRTTKAKGVPGEGASGTGSQPAFAVMNWAGMTGMNTPGYCNPEDSTIAANDELEGSTLNAITDMKNIYKCTVVSSSFSFSSYPRALKVNQSHAK